MKYSYNMPLLPLKPSSRVVGDLACQRDSYLRTIDSEVISCVEASPPKTNGTKNSSKKGVSTPEPEKIYFIEFADSVLFPEGISPESRDRGSFD
jgi:misacylated tRNA(Ala) deacylase